MNTVPDPDVDSYLTTWAGVYLGLDMREHSKQFHTTWQGLWWENWRPRKQGRRPRLVQGERRFLYVMPGEHTPSCQDGPGDTCYSSTINTLVHFHSQTIRYTLDYKLHGQPREASGTSFFPWKRAGFRRAWKSSYTSLYSVQQLVQLWGISSHNYIGDFTIINVVPLWAR